MRVAAFTGTDGPDDVAVQEQPDPTPAAGEAVIEVAACSINHHDLWILEGDSGMVGTDELPFVSGLDVAGEVAATGPDVDSVASGDRVLLCPNETCGTCRYCREGPENRCEQYSLYHGGLAEQALVDADRLVALPESVDFTDAAALPTAYMTAYHMLRRTDVGANDLVFIPGATGGVGVAGVQLVDALGARSIGTTTSATKADRLADIGADHVVESGAIDEIRAAVDEIGEPDAVLNHLGGDYTQLGLALLRQGGRMAICGRTAGDRSTIEIPQLYLGHNQLIGSTMGTQPDLETLVDLTAAGAIDPVVNDEYALDETGQAFADMQRRDAFGKLVVQP
ncbi:alcohol dehydrogenase catalytic domain-containing protein [Halococcus thailandensis]|uniref:Alcohol dehydrogenase zinc-binding domain protein n=1 Tax=Halococcus thailandensis JCM 13552 TaxID=1227457 RepID=M0N8X8_9EURY|nr:alcohol dehydrogenase catalytic domain-containing protein [Halococcus thailandensis]EMA54341.1 alcohol dehydrogenase zinc-binding domain protein [Halococcus thailandensis JCM 13552]